MITHYKNGCEFKGYFSEFTEEKTKVTCKRCRNKYRIDSNKKTIIVKVGKYLNVLDLEFMTDEMTRVAMIKHPNP